MEARRLLGRLHDRTGQFGRSSAAVGEVGAHRGPGAGRFGQPPDGLVLGGVVVGEGVDGHHRGDAVHPDVLDLLAQVGAALEDLVGVLGQQRRAATGGPATMRCWPECAFSARTVATTTAASGRRPEARHLMLKNRSAPMSAPKPASVMR